jgi:hypothetical protein
VIQVNENSVKPNLLHEDQWNLGGHEPAVPLRVLSLEPAVVSSARRRGLCDRAGHLDCPTVFGALAPAGQPRIRVVYVLFGPKPPRPTWLNLSFDFVPVMNRL